MRNKTVRRRKLDLSKTSRQKALLDVKTLYSLLPGAQMVSYSDQFGAPEKSINFKTLPSAQEGLLLNAFLKKFPGFTGEDPKAVAKKKFLEYEDHCSRTNTFLKSLRQGRITDPWLNTILFVAQRKISSVLGSVSVNEWLDLSRWGPGTTSSCKGSDVSASAKFKARADCTRESLFWVRSLLPLLPSWSAMLADQDYGAIVNPMVHVIAGNKVTFVPKTAKTHRTIAIEPHLNIFFQIGLGRLIRRRMKIHAKVDLDDQSLNQRLACLGSKDNSLATIDLEGASDTVSLEIVRDLLPEPWFNVLDSLRSHTGLLDGEVIRYSKFSSMGNGATFDLESLIFWALSSAVVETEGYNPFWVNVFGDDIVVPSGCYDKVAEALTKCGFIVNNSKSFSNGPFRESCGHDYYLGINVRPVYLKKIPFTSVDWMVIANQIRILAHRWVKDGCDTRLLPAYRFALSRIERSYLRYRVPYAMNGVVGSNVSNGILSNFDEAAPYLAKDEGRGFEGFYCNSISAFQATYTVTDRSLVVSSVFQPGSTSNEIPLKDKVSIREETLFVPGDWYNFGPWRRFNDASFA